MELLRGAFDIHVHAGPSVAKRKYGAHQALKLAEEAGLAGIMLVDHVVPTAPIAEVLNGLGFKARAYGGIMLNYPLGGFNPFAVETAISMGTRQISMPSYNAAGHIDKYGAVHSVFPYHQSSDEKGMRILDGRGHLLKEVETLLDMLVGTSAHLSTGHLCVEEIVKLVKRARERGVERVLINSVSTDIIDMPLQIQREIAGDGVFFEHNYIAMTSTPLVPTPLERIVSDIVGVGPERCIIASDSGQPENPDLISALKEFIRLLLEKGPSERDIEIMIRDNPRELLAV